MGFPCSCNVPFEEIGSGSIGLSGTATVSGGTLIGSGGITFGSSARVDTNEPFDGLVYCLALNEYDSFPDLGPNGLDGSSDRPAQLETGVGCSYAQQLTGYSDGKEYVAIPQDNHSGPFSVSIWVYISSLYEVRTLYTRGQSVWNFRLSHSFLNHIVGTIQDDEGNMYDAYSDDTVEQNRWYHVGATWDGATLTLYINGEEVGSVAAEVTLPEADGSYVGRWLDGAYPTGRVQEVRLHAEARSQAYFDAEHANICNPGFYSFGTPVAL